MKENLFYSINFFSITLLEAQDLAFQKILIYYFKIVLLGNIKNHFLNLRSLLNVSM